VIKKPLIIPFLITLIFSTFSPIAIHTANAATVGTAPCDSTVSSATGVTVTVSGDYCYVSFTSTAAATTWTVPAGVTSADLLLIAGGGGGGGGAWGGGGGAGEVLSYVNYSVASATPVSITVGSGGGGGIASLDSNGNRAISGSNSSVAAVVAKGGGAGASYAYGSTATLADGSNGGSGGGGTEHETQRYGGSSTKSATSGSITAFGNIGGNGSAGAGTQAGGGGGGAGAAGSNAGYLVGGAGGGGTNTFSTWITAISSAMSGVTGWSTATTSGFIAGGGAGAAARATSSTGGSGGGGNSGNNTGGAALSGQSGITNTGSGGGGASYNNGGGSGGSGGSGLVVVKYLQPITITITTITNKLFPRVSTTASATVSSGSKTYSSSNAPVCTVNSSTGVVTFVSTGSCSITATASSSPNPTASTTFQIVPNITQKLISRTGIQPNALSSFIPPPYLSTLETYTVTSCVSIVGATGADLLSSTNLSFSLASLLVAPGVITDTGAGKSYTITGTLAQVQAAFSIFKLNSSSGRIMAANSGSIYLRARTNLVVDSATDTGCQDFNDARITLYQYTSDQIRRKNVPQKSGSTP